MRPAPSPAAPPSAADLAPVPGQRAVSGRRMRPAEPDAALLALGRQFDAAWGAERAALGGSDDLLEAAALRSQALARRILRARATTLGGLLVKIRIAAWCHAGEPIDDAWLTDAGWAGDEQTTDVRTVMSILRDLAAIDSCPPPVAAAKAAA